MLEKSHHVEASPQVVRKLKSKVMNHFDPVVGWTGLATLCSALVQYFSNRRSELWSEMVCWIALPFMIHARTALSTKEHGIDWVLSGPRLSLPTGLRPQLTSSSISLWVVAVCLGVVALFKAEYETWLFCTWIAFSRDSPIHAPTLRCGLAMLCDVGNDPLYLLTLFS